VKPTSNQRNTQDISAEFYLAKVLRSFYEWFLRDSVKQGTNCKAMSDHRDQIYHSLQMVLEPIQIRLRTKGFTIKIMKYFIGLSV
jgi:hypothetical protein